MTSDEITETHREELLERVRLLDNAVCAIRHALIFREPDEARAATDRAAQRLQALVLDLAPEGTAEALAAIEARGARFAPATRQFCDALEMHENGTENEHGGEP